MPSRLSAIFARSDKAEEAKAEAAAAERNSPPSDPVPEYSASHPPPPDYVADEESVAAPPDYTAGFANLNIADGPSLDIPKVNETIAHLKLLECFYRLKQRIGSTDGLFGINNDKIVDLGRKSDLSNGETAKDLLPKVAEKRWAVYVARAVDRFNAWLSVYAPADDLPTIVEFDRDGRLGLITEPSYVKRSAIPITTANMPPVDVVMVWHAYMLNPRAYLEDCIRLGRMDLWNMRMPWNAVASSVDASTFAFQPGPLAEGAFTRLTGRYWDNLVDGDVKKVECPNCQTLLTASWTTCCTFEPAEETNRSLTVNVEAMLASGAGFCDRKFATTCSGCETQITHNTLRAGKFCSDLRQLLAKRTPMPGTILGLRGIPIKVGTSSDPSWKKVFFVVNNLLSYGLGQKILDQPNLKGEGLNQSMARIRDMISTTITDSKKYMRTVRDSASHKMTRLESVGFRKMMSRYWENSSPFAIDLVGAVVRQGNFIEKMHSIDWLHSPALPATMARLILKYERFVKLMDIQPGKMAVPTLDVDLAWHTHQLNPPSYLKYTVSKSRQFVDHDDKVSATKLDDAFAWTSKTYEKMFGDKYSECTCWYCEAVRESNMSSATRLFSSKGKEKLHDVEQDPKKSVHISAHNAVHPYESKQYSADAQAQAAKLEAAYEKACERAKKKGENPPKRDDYYWSTAYGYPVWIPAYSPFIYVGYTPGLYATTPSCMALHPGAGACVAGTCSGTVSAGACGAGTCAGGITGGCSGGHSLGGGMSSCGGGVGGCGGGGGN